MRFLFKFWCINRTKNRTDIYTEKRQKKKKYFIVVTQTIAKSHGNDSFNNYVYVCVLVYKKKKAQKKGKRLSQTIGKTLWYVVCLPLICVLGYNIWLLLSLFFFFFRTRQENINYCHQSFPLQTAIPFFTSHYSSSWLFFSFFFSCYPLLHTKLFIRCVLCICAVLHCYNIGFCISNSRFFNHTQWCTTKS